MVSQETPVPGRAVTLCVLLMASMTIMANATIAPSLPGLKSHFSSVAGIDTLAGLVLSLPSLAIVLTAGLWGWMADRFNRQTMLIVSGVLFTLGGTSGLWTGSIQTMLVGRFIMGLGVAGTMTLAMTWGSDLWQGEARARFMGLQGAAMSIGGLLVIILGGALATLHWRGAFAVYAAVAPITIFALIMLAPYAKARAERGALPQRQAEAGGLEFPWAPFAVVGSLGFIFMAIVYLMPTRAPFLMQQLGVSNALVIGLIMAAMNFAAIPGALGYGRIRQYISAFTLFGLAFMVVGFGILIVALAIGPLTLLLGSIVIGIGMGPSIPNYTTYLMTYVPAPLRGRASGLLTTAFFAGQFVSPLVSAPLVAMFGLGGAFEVIALGVLCFGAVITAIGLMRRSPAVAQAR